MHPKFPQICPQLPSSWNKKYPMPRIPSFIPWNHIPSAELLSYNDKSKLAQAQQGVHLSDRQVAWKSCLQRQQCQITWERIINISIASINWSTDQLGEFGPIKLIKFHGNIKWVQGKRFLFFPTHQDFHAWTDYHYTLVEHNANIPNWILPLLNVDTRKHCKTWKRSPSKFRSSKLNSKQTQEEWDQKVKDSLP